MNLKDVAVIVLTDRMNRMQGEQSHAWRYVVMSDNGDQACEHRGIYICQETDRDEVWNALQRRYGDRLVAVTETGKDAA